MAYATFKEINKNYANTLPKKHCSSQKKKNKDKIDFWADYGKFDSELFGLMNHIKTLLTRWCTRAESLKIWWEIQ